MLPGFDFVSCFVSACRPKKLLYSSTDANFDTAVHELYDASLRMENICRYDLDELDTTWLTEYNRLRQQTGTLRMLCCYELQKLYK